MLSIGLFGGSFDPIHSGHLLLAEKAIKELNLDILFFVPSLLPPHKQRKLSIAFHRQRMLHIAIGKHQKLTVSNFELTRKERTYTYQTLEYFREKYPDATFYLIMGSDSAIDLKNWKRAKEITQTSKIVFAKRDGYNKKIGSGFLKLKGVIKNISSTEIRERVKKGFSIRGFVAPAVAEYIKKNGLYK